MASFSSGFANPQSTASNSNAKNKSRQEHKNPFNEPVQDFKAFTKNHWQLVELELLLNQIDRNNANDKTLSTMQQFDHLWNQLDNQAGHGQYQAKPFLDDLLKRFNTLVSKHWDGTLNNKNHPINQYPQLTTSLESITVSGKEQAKQLKHPIENAKERSSDKITTKSRSNSVRSCFQNGAVETEPELTPPCELGFSADQLSREIEGLWQYLNQNPGARHLQLEQLRYQFNAPLLSQTPQAGDWLFQQWQQATGPMTRATSQAMAAQLLKRLCPCPACQGQQSNPIRAGT